jgi:DNA-binding protein H-NS
LRITACLIQLQEIADLQKELAAEAAANEAKRIAEIEALAREQEEMRLTLAQLDPEMLELAAPEVKNAQKLERRAEAVDVVFDMCAKVPRL